MDAYKKYLEKRDRWLQEHCPTYPALIKCSDDCNCNQLVECFKEWHKAALGIAKARKEKN